MVRELVLIRHGVTLWNKGRRLQGHQDVGLSDEGLQQVEALRRWALRLPPPDALYSSDLKRAHDTALPLSTGWGLPLKQTFALRERGFGIYEGQDWDHVHDILEREAAAVGISPQHYVPRGGESRQQVEQRLSDFLHHLDQHHAGERVWLVSHGGVIRNLLRRLLANETEHLLSGFHIPNTSVSRLRRQGAGWVSMELVSVAHLGLAERDGSPSSLISWQDESEQPARHQP